MTSGHYRSLIEVHGVQEVQGVPGVRGFRGSAGFRRFEGSWVLEFRGFTCALGAENLLNP
jgi:hypothetical protein